MTQPAPDGCAVTIPQDWQQGRTTYGGLTAALCVAAAQRAVPDLPKLRSALFSFIGPAGGDVRLEPATLRRGKNTVFMAVNLSGEAGLATQATLVFGAARDSALSHDALAMPACPAPESSPPFFGSFAGPVFARHFDYRNAGGASPASGGHPEYRIWLRHTDPALGDSAAALVAIADAPPPAAMALFAQWGPISTITWMIDLFDAPPADGTAWHLLTCSAEKVAHGYSTQHMAMWRADGTPLLIARQNIAIFV